MQDYQKIFLELAFANAALRFGEFTLKSGRISPYFFNVGQLSSGSALRVLGECYAFAIQAAKIPYDRLFGPAYKGIPLVCTTAIALATRFQQNIPFCFNRKEAKDHGEGGQIIGHLAGRALIIDDVITAGTAIRESFQIIHAANAQAVGIIVALDRQEKGQGSLSAIQEIQENFDVPVKAIVTFADILEFVAKDPQLAKFKKPMEVYREIYGV